MKKRRKMPFQHSLQSSRFEFKYIIDEPRAADVRDFVQSYLEPDEFAASSQGNSYQISSLYWDNATRFLYRQTVIGAKNRFKLRVRIYDNNPESPAFLEIKRRVTDVILKERATVTRQGVLDLIARRAPDESWLLGSNANAKSRAALLTFSHLSDRLGAGPCIYVSYRREAYVSPESNAIRVCFDRQLMGSPYEHGANLALPTRGARPETGNHGKVILELKFTDRFPTWMREMAHALDLQRTSVPKYVLCLNAMEKEPRHWRGESGVRSDKKATRCLS
jgi:hypothetical protein